MMVMKDARALSATICTSRRLSPTSDALDEISSGVIVFGNFHTSKNASPIFLFADPPCKWTSTWTILAIVLTNSIMSS